MDEHVARLIWALPLVLLLGVAGLWALKRLGLGEALRPPSPTPELLGTAVLSEHTKVLVFQAHGHAYMVVESTANVQVQPLDAGAPSVQSRSPWAIRKIL